MSGPKLLAIVQLNTLPLYLVSGRPGLSNIAAGDVSHYTSTLFIMNTVDIAVTVKAPYLSSPGSLAAIHPALTHVRQIGQLSDAQLVSVTKEDWDTMSEDILKSLKAADGVVSVNVQQPKQRSKRGDEL
ncbi:hypothetical protein D9758_006036 [Tetrapyrgos nigripes]|uniref:Uncharacterized protein n=1 Tax=Tetrapyrgos nigripes TaxID=182062 RepID=A0A8H5D7Z9_9AGAR|nr:hypothetical protein D9758_006036 [Tetrapyrgos nigripes]